MVTAWILDEDPERRATAAVALESAGYHDVVAFEDAQQLLAHRPCERPGLAVIDAWTARFDAREIHLALTGVALVVLVADDEHDAPWRSLGVARVLRRVTSTPSPPASGFGAREGPSGTRAVRAELRQSRATVEGGTGDGAIRYVTWSSEDPSRSPCAKSLQELLASIGRSS